MSDPAPQRRPILGSIALFLLVVVVPALFLSLVGNGDATPRDNLAAIEPVLFRILVLLSCGALGVTLAITSLVRRERPRWLSILALAVGVLPFGVTFVVVAIIILHT